MFILIIHIYPIYSIVQRVGIVEVSLTVVSQLGAKLTSTDRGQASEVLGKLLLTAAVVIVSSS